MTAVLVVATVIIIGMLYVAVGLIGVLWRETVNGSGPVGRVAATVFYLALSAFTVLMGFAAIVGMWRVES